MGRSKRLWYSGNLIRSAIVEPICCESQACVEDGRDGCGIEGLKVQQ